VGQLRRARHPQGAGRGRRPRRKVTL
jgi:hypothetical protein